MRSQCGSRLCAAISRGAKAPPTLKKAARLCRLLRFYFGLQDATPNVQIALRIRDLDPGFAQFFFDGEIQIAFEPAGTMAHLAAPDDQLEIERAVAELLQENAGCGVFEDMSSTSAGG